MSYSFEHHCAAHNTPFVCTALNYGTVALCFVSIPISCFKTWIERTLNEILLLLLRRLLPTCNPKQKRINYLMQCRHLHFFFSCKPPTWFRVGIHNLFASNKPPIFLITLYFFKITVENYHIKFSDFCKYSNIMFKNFKKGSYLVAHHLKLRTRKPSAQL